MSHSSLPAPGVGAPLGTTSQMSGGYLNKVPRSSFGGVPQSMSAPSVPLPTSARSMSSLPRNSVPQLAPVVEAGKDAGLKSSDSPRTELEEVLEAERLWWSEASERQVKELESQFGDEFQRTTGRLRADMSAIADRLDALLEKERNQRHAQFADLRREFDNQQLGFSDLKHQMSLLLSDQRGRAPQGGNMGDEAVTMTRLREELDSLRLRQEARTTSLLADWNQHKVDLSAAQAQLADMRKELIGSREANSAGGSRADQMIEELRSDFLTHRHELASIKEKSHLQMKSNEEIQQLHTVVIQSAADLGRGIEEVSAAVSASEQKLRDYVNMKVARIHDEVTKEATDRISHVKELKASLELMKSSFEHEHASSRGVVASMQNQINALTSEAKLGNADSSPRGMPEVMQRVEEALKGASDRALRIEARLVEEMAEERKLRSSEIAQLRTYTEEMSKRAPLAAALADPSCARSGPRSETVQDLWSELSLLKSSILNADAEARRASAAATRVETEVQSIDERMRKQVILGPRIDALEVEIRETAREADLRRVDAELRRLMRDVAPLAPQLEALEAESRRSMRELERTCSTARDGVEALRAEVDAVHGRSAMESVQVRRAMDARVSRPSIEGRSPSQTPNLQGRSASQTPNLTRSPAPSSAWRTSVQSNSDQSRARGAALSPPRPETTLGSTVPSDLKDSIHNLVRKVNDTLRRPVDVNRSLGDGGTTGSTVGHGSAVSDGGSVNTSTHSGHTLTASASARPGAETQGGMLRAMNAVRELQAQNLSLREKNVELAEELLEKNQAPSASKDSVLPRWTPSQQQSPTVTPSRTPGAGSQTAQVVGLQPFSSSVNVSRSPSALSPLSAARNAQPLGSAPHSSRQPGGAGSMQVPSGAGSMQVQPGALSNTARAMASSVAHGPVGQPGFRQSPMRPVIHRH